MRHPSGNAFINKPPSAKAIETKLFRKRAFPLGHELGKAPARSRNGFEPACAPTAVDKGVAQRGFAQNG